MNIDVPKILAQIDQHLEESDSFYYEFPLGTIDQGVCDIINAHIKGKGFDVGWIEDDGVLEVHTFPKGTFSSPKEDPKPDGPAERIRKAYEEYVKTRGE